MIEFGEPLHIYGITFILLSLSFLIGVTYGSVSNETEKNTKNND